MSEISVRSARESDFEAARAVLRDAYAEFESVLPPENWLAYIADIVDLEGRTSASELLVAERGGEIVACVSYYPPGAEISYPSDAFSEHWPADWSAIRLLAVHSAARGGGVGRLLTEACIERARADGAPAIGLHTMVHMGVAKAMYERMGFARAPKYDFRVSPEIFVEAYQLLL